MPVGRLETVLQLMVTLDIASQNFLTIITKCRIFEASFRDKTLTFMVNSTVGLLASRDFYSESR